MEKKTFNKWQRYKREKWSNCWIEMDAMADVIWIKWQNVITNHAPNDGISIAVKWLQRHVESLSFQFLFPFRRFRMSSCSQLYKLWFYKDNSIFPTLFSLTLHSFANILTSIQAYIHLVIRSAISSSSIQQMPPASTVWSAPWFSISGIQIRWRNKKNIFSPAPFDEIYISVSLIV